MTEIQHNIEEMVIEKANSEKVLRDTEIYSNFATPLIGTFLNLPNESTYLKCPSCGVEEMTKVEHELKWWTTEINRLFGCLFITLCCCCCFDYKLLCKKCDVNHYCPNCGCYFGRSRKYKAIKIKNNNV